MDSSIPVLAFVLIVAGFLLLGAELFFPSGILFVLAVASIAIGVALAIGHDPVIGVITLIFVFIAIPVVGGLMMHYWPRTSVGQRFFLPGPDTGATVAAMPPNQELEQLRGRYGRAVSPLRPSGMTDFDGRRIDTITEGMMVDAGQWVRCIDVQAGKVIVRPAERPSLGDLETAIFS